MKIPDAVEVTPAHVDAIARRLGIAFAAWSALPSSGIINSVFALGDDLVLRVPRQHPEHLVQAEREALVIPAAVEAGVRTAALISLDESLEILPVPYLVVERLQGQDYESLGWQPAAHPTIWRDLGRDLARLHSGTPPASLPSSPVHGHEPRDPRHLVEECAEDGWISVLEAAWLLRWLDHLASMGADRGVACFAHGDVQMANVLVDVAAQRYLGLIDWGCSYRAPASRDFGALPMAAVVEALAGHREMAGRDADGPFEAGIVWRKLQLILSVLPRGAAPGLSWGERPTAWLVDLLGFFTEVKDDEWRSAAPVASA
jgi:aminoglycoside phosphotransferase (APT) family kinase protein